MPLKSIFSTIIISRLSKLYPQRPRRQGPQVSGHCRCRDDWRFFFCDLGAAVASKKVSWETDAHSYKEGYRPKRMLGIVCLPVDDHRFPYRRSLKPYFLLGDAQAPTRFLVRSPERPR